MKIALFSDIHSNLPALEQFFEVVEEQKPDAIYCLGDLVGYNIWPNEVVQKIRDRNIPCIAGNYDWGIGRASDDCGCAYKTDEERANGAVSIRVTNELVDDEVRKYLRTLPAQINLQFELQEGVFFNLLLVHGSPRKINEYLFEDRPEKSLLRILKNANADMLCFGHTHKPYHRIIEDTENGHFRHALNIGSIGKPKDGDSRGGYALLHFDENSAKDVKDSVRVKFLRFDYDIEKAARAIEGSDLPNAYAEALRNAK